MASRCRIGLNFKRFVHMYWTERYSRVTGGATLSPENPQIGSGLTRLLAHRQHDGIAFYQPVSNSADGFSPT